MYRDLFFMTAQVYVKEAAGQIWADMGRYGQIWADMG